MKRLTAFLLALTLVFCVTVTALADDDTEEIDVLYVAEEIPLGCRSFICTPDKYCLIKPVSGSWNDCVGVTDFLYSFDGGKNWLEARRGDEGTEVFIDGKWTNLNAVAEELGTSLTAGTMTVPKLDVEVKTAREHFNGKSAKKFGLKLKLFK